MREGKIHSPHREEASVGSVGREGVVTDHHDGASVGRLQGLDETGGRPGRVGVDAVRTPLGLEPPVRIDGHEADPGQVVNLGTRAPGNGREFHSAPLFEPGRLPLHRRQAPQLAVVPVVVPGNEDRACRAHGLELGRQSPFGLESSIRVLRREPGWIDVVTQEYDDRPVRERVGGVPECLEDRLPLHNRGARVPDQDDPLHHRGFGRGGRSARHGGRDVGRRVTASTDGKGKSKASRRHQPPVSQPSSTTPGTPGHESSQGTVTQTGR